MGEGASQAWLSAWCGRPPSNAQPSGGRDRSPFGGPPALPVTKDADPEVIAAAVDRLILGRPDARLVPHAIPAAAPSPACTCEAAAACGGIVPDADCPEHGGVRSPQMWWHWEGAACTIR